MRRTAPPTSTVHEVGGTTSIPNQQDQIRDYRRWQRLRHEWNRRTRRNNRPGRALESALNPEAELEWSQRRRANMVPAETLYEAGWNTTNHRVYQHYSEQTVRVTDDHQESLPFINEVSYNQLQREQFSLMHTGLILVRLQVLHRREAGTMAMVALRQTNWQDDRAIIGAAEVDLSRGSQLVYFIPDLLMSLEGVHRRLELVIRTRGYDNWTGPEPNLIITRALVGRLTNTSHAAFRYRIAGVTDYLSSHGIQAIPGELRTARELRGRQWELKPPKETRLKNPTAFETRTRLDKSISLRFMDYEDIEEPREPNRGNEDEEATEEEFAMMMWEDNTSTEVTSAWEEALRKTMKAEKAKQELTQRIQQNIAQASQKDHMKLRYPMSNWDYLGQDSGRYNYIVDYSPPSWAAASQEPVEPTGWESDPEDEEDPESSEAIEQVAIHDEEESTDYYTASEGSDAEPEHDIAASTLDYPHLRQLEAYSGITDTQSSAYRPPTEPVMGQVNYPPAIARPRPDDKIDQIKQTASRFRAGPSPKANQWELPNAQQVQGAMLVMPDDFSKTLDVIARWESITKNHLQEKVFSDNQAKMDYVENLLGENEKRLWIQWRMAYPADYQALTEICDDTQNIISAIRRIFTLEDPYQGSTVEQERAYADLERLSCRQTKDLFEYMIDFRRLAAQSGRAYFPDTAEKFFRKMPPHIGKEIEKAYLEKYPGAVAGVEPRIHFSYNYLAEICKKVAFQKEVRDLSFCARIPVPGYYKSEKKYGLRKSTTYKGKPHSSHLRVFKKKHGHTPKVRKCKCFICGEEGHYARECKSSSGNLARVAIMQNTDIPEDCDVVSVDLNEQDSEGICSLSEGEVGGLQLGGLLEALPWEEHMHALGEGSTCIHTWNFARDKGVNCSLCSVWVSNPALCENCGEVLCPLCVFKEYKIKRQVQKAVPEFKTKEDLIKCLLDYVTYLLAENDRLQGMIKEKFLQDAEELGKNTPPEALAFLQEATYKAEEATNSSPRQRINKLFNLVVEFDIPGIQKFHVQAILDTGASNCCINMSSVPEEAMEENSYVVSFNGINSRQEARHRLKTGTMEIGGHRFRIPFTYCFPMTLKDSGIAMLLGCNFIRNMYGGLRIEGNTLTFYKNITTISTTSEAEITCPVQEILELTKAQEDACPSWGETSSEFRSRFGRLLGDLEKQGVIGESPLRLWERNKIQCELDIINPDITIMDRPLKHITPTMSEQFKRHTKALLELGVIRPSTSRHRTTAIIVSSGTSVNAATGKEEKGKERMVFDYRALNDNTHPDQYNLPGVNTLLKKVGRAKIFSKFDLKSGFHQVAMAKESIPWTTFSVPGGLYEWLVMPFGLKNAPAIFQRKMDMCFKELDSFVAVYIDDILVYSEGIEEHANHLKQVLRICEKEGLVLSKNKMKIATSEVEFLGMIIGNGKIRLQPHIIQKIADFSEEDLKTKKGLRSWLGILNYSRNHIPNLGRLLGPLYAKTGPHGDKRFKPEDWNLVRQVKMLIKGLPDLEFPPTDAHIIIEADGSMEGWGAILKWKPKAGDSPSLERIAAYASGKFQCVKSPIDAEIFACMGALDKFKIHYLDKGEVTLRTDCQAIISFYNKSAVNKPSRVRWLSFTDYLTGTGVKVKLEHIDGKHNLYADILSRLVGLLIQDQEPKQFEVMYQAIQEFNAKPNPEVEKRLWTAARVSLQKATPTQPRDWFQPTAVLVADPGPYIEQSTLSPYKYEPDQGTAYTFPAIMSTHIPNPRAGAKRRHTSQVQPTIPMEEPHSSQTEPADHPFSDYPLLCSQPPDSPPKDIDLDPLPSDSELRRMPEYYFSEMLEKGSDTPILLQRKWSYHGKAQAALLEERVQVIEKLKEFERIMVKREEHFASCSYSDNYYSSWKMIVKEERKSVAAMITAVENLNLETAIL